MPLSENLVLGFLGVGSDMGDLITGLVGIKYIHLTLLSLPYIAAHSTSATIL